jgi:hypothetical protein
VCLHARQAGWHTGHIAVPLPIGLNPGALVLAFVAPILMCLLVYKSADVVQWPECGFDPFFNPCREPVHQGAGAWPPSPSSTGMAWAVPRCG